MRLDEKLNRLCEARRLTNQRELAKLADVTKSSLNRWLNGKSVPDLFEAGRLARILGVPLDYLADDAQDEPPAPAELPEDERFLLRSFRALGISADVAVSRMAGQVTFEPMTPEEIEALTNPEPEPKRFRKTS